MPSFAAIGTKIGSTIYEISTKSIKKPSTKITAILKMINPHFSPGKFVMKFSTISSPPV